MTLLKVLITLFLFTVDVPTEALKEAASFLERQKKNPQSAIWMGYEPHDAVLGTPLSCAMLGHGQIEDFLNDSDRRIKDHVTYGYTVPVLDNRKIIGKVDLDCIDGRWTPSMSWVGDRDWRETKWGATLSALGESHGSAKYTRIRLRTCLFEVPVLEDDNGEWYVIADAGTIQPINSVYAMWEEEMKRHLYGVEMQPPAKPDPVVVLPHKLRPEVRISQRPYATAVDGEAIDTLPRMREYEDPTYPVLPMKAGISGEVLIAIVVDSEGRVKNERIKWSQVSPVMETSAIVAAKTAVFRPALRGDTPVECETDIVVHFELK